MERENKLLLWALLGMLAEVLLFFLVDWKVALCIILSDFSIYWILKLD